MWKKHFEVETEERLVQLRSMKREPHIYIYICILNIRKDKMYIYILIKIYMQQHL